MWSLCRIVAWMFTLILKCLCTSLTACRMGVSNMKVPRATQAHKTCAQSPRPWAEGTGSWTGSRGAGQLPLAGPVPCIWAEPEEAEEPRRPPGDGGAGPAGAGGASAAAGPGPPHRPTRRTAAVLIQNPAVTLLTPPHTSHRNFEAL